MKIFTIDLETTGREKPFEAPTQVGVKVFDSTGKETEAIDARGRIPRHVLASPGALAVTGQRIYDLQNAPRSSYEFARYIHQLIKRNSPAVVAGYNNISYDEEVLRHTFYGNLMQPYITQFGGNERLDVLLAMKAAKICDPSAFDLPINAKGKQSFKLEDLAPAFGYTGHDAHDALADVDATMFVAQTIRSRSPEVWKSTRLMRSKARMDEVLEKRQPVVKLHWNHRGDKPSIKVLLPVCRDREIPSKWWCVDLNCKIDRVIAADVGTIRKAISASTIVGVTVNKMPLVLPLSDPAIAKLDFAFDQGSVEKLTSDGGLSEVIQNAAQMIRDDYEPKVHVQDQLYSGGFFPVDEDKSALTEFHMSEPASKYEIVGSLCDQRAKVLGKLLIGSEWPEVMSPGDLRAYEEEVQQRFFADDVPWMTVPKALEEIKELRPAVGKTANILEEYEYWLQRLRSRGFPYAAE